MRVGCSRRHFGAALVGGTALACIDHRREPTLMPFDQPSDPIRRLAGELTRSADSPRSAALALYAHVRDTIAFGFTSRFDQATPEQTLALGRGHCNPQATLLCSLLMAVGVEARQHFVSIPSTILDGLFTRFPLAVITHSYVDVRLDGEWIAIDGYILDRPLWRRSLARLRSEQRELGYGAHVAGTIDWDGRRSCMSQFADPSMALADHGQFVDPAEFYAGPHYRQRLRGLGRLFYAGLAAPDANRRIAALRTGG